MSEQDGYLSVGEVRLYWRAWLPESEPRAVVLFSHGLGEHNGRYGYIASRMNDVGIAMYAIDHYGHGKSDGKRGAVPDYEFFLDGLSALLDEIQKRHPDKKVFVYGHSLGGQIALNFALRRPNGIYGLVSTGVWLQIPFEPPAWKLALARFLYKVLPDLRLNNELDPKYISRDPEVVKAYVADPLVHDRISVRLFNQGLAAAQFAFDNAADMKMPVLLMHGGADKLTASSGTKKFYDQVGSVDRRLKVYEGLYHEIHNEPEKAQVLTDIVEWLNKHL